MQHIDCKKYSQQILDEVKKVTAEKSLYIFTVGENPASQSYVKGKIKDCEYCNIPYHHLTFPDCEVSKTRLATYIKMCNDDDTVGGIIVQLPLPEGWNEEYYTNMIRPEKDVDGFVHGSHFNPCTPEGIMYVLQQELGELTGRNALVIGRGKLVGQPIVKMLLDADCTVTVAHSKTKKNTLDRLIKDVDIIICAVGKANFLDLCRCESCIVIDVGVNRNEEGKLCGDCFNFYENALTDVRVTPVPGGIGLMTRAMLMNHMKEANQFDKNKASL